MNLNSFWEEENGEEKQAGRGNWQGGGHVLAEGHQRDSKKASVLALVKTERERKG